jgi:hypothetical protein
LYKPRDRGEDEGDPDGEPTVNVALRWDPVVSGDAGRWNFVGFGDELKNDKLNIVYESFKIPNLRR